MDKVLQQIKDGVFDKDPEPPKPRGFIFAKVNKKQNTKQDWYIIGKVVTRKHKVQLHKEQRRAARRTYEYYGILKGNWIGPSPRQLGKMIEAKYQQYLKGRKDLEEEWTMPHKVEETLEVEGPTSSSGGNMLESQEDLLEKSRDNNMWMSDDWFTGLESFELPNLDQERVIGQNHGIAYLCATSDDRRPPSAVRHPPSAARRPPSAVRRPPSAVRRPPPAVRRPSPVVRHPFRPIRIVYFLFLFLSKNV